MKELWMKNKWIFDTIIGSTVFALGFSLFLAPNDMSAGGISGLALIFVELTGLGSVGTLSILINLPLFILGGLKIGKRFFAGSLLGMLLSSVLIDLFVLIPMPSMEPLICVLYGGVICGLGLGVVFSRSVVSDSLRPHGLQHARLLCLSVSPGVCSNSCPLSW